MLYLSVNFHELQLLQWHCISVLDLSRLRGYSTVTLHNCFQTNDVKLKEWRVISRGNTLGQFHKRAVSANVPSSSFWSRGTSECTLVPGFGTLFFLYKGCTHQGRCATKHPSKNLLRRVLETAYEKAPRINKLKTTPTPNKNGSHGIKGGFVCHIFGSVCHIFCRNPLILTDFYAIRTPIIWHILGAYFWQIRGLGVVRIIFKEGFLEGVLQ